MNNVLKLLRKYCFFIKKKLLLNTTKVNPRILLFTSTPDYSDNARALSDYLVDNDNGYLEKYDVYWIVSNPKRFSEKYPNSKIHFIKPRGWKSLKIALQASWSFCTHSFVCAKKSDSRVGQHFIKLWHGCSYKDKDKKRQREQKKPDFDKVLVAGPLFVSTKCYFWNCTPDMILSKGYPRYDYLLRKTKEALTFYNEIRGENNKVVIWMPTFRNDKNGIYNETDNIIEFPILSSMDKWFELDEYCKLNRIVIVIKLHPFQRDYDIPWDRMLNIRRIDDSDFENNNIVLYSFLSVTDGLISDYSSVAVDYLIVDKPIAYTLDDYELYLKGRGFIIENPKEYMPGHHLYNMDDLKTYLIDVASGNDVYKSRRDSVFGSLIYRSCNYCKEIVEDLGL